MRALVCGGRNYSDYIKFTNSLNQLHEQMGFTAIIHGAASGADTLADRWAKTAGVPVKTFPASWKTHDDRCGYRCRQGQYCRRAGFRRNEQMLHQGRPDVVIAFPGGPGTASMIKLAQDASVMVIQPAG